MTYTVNSLSATTQLEILMKEGVSDQMSNLFPLDMPLHQILEQMPIQSTFYEFPIDTFLSSRIARVSSVFEAASGAGASTIAAKPEKHTYTDLTDQYPAKIRGVVEIQGQSFSVSDTNRAISQHAISDRFALEALKSTQAVGNNFEHSFWWSPGTVAGGADLDSSGGGTYWVRQTQGLVHWIAKSGLERSKIGLTADSFLDGNGNQFGDGGATEGGPLNRSMSWMYDAGGATLDQSMFKNDLMNQWYNLTGIQGGAVGFTGAAGKQMISQFALTANGPINERNIDAAAKMVTDTVDWYETDFGLVSINLCRYLNISGQSVGIKQSNDATTTVPYNEVLLFIKPQYYKIGVLRPIHLEVLAKTGSFESGFVEGEMGLFCKNPMAGAGICNFVP